MPSNVSEQPNMSLREREQTMEEYRDMTPLFIGSEEVKRRDIRVSQALLIINSTQFNWSRSPVGILQDKLQTLGLDCTVFEEDLMLFCNLIQRLFEKFKRISKNIDHCCF